MRGRMLSVLVGAGVLLSLIPGAVAAQEPGRIVGRVVDAGQGAPISGAQVELVGGDAIVVSALDGRFALTGVPAGPATVRVRMIGYAAKLVSGIAVRAGETVAQDISLEPATVEVAEIAVTSEAERGSVSRALDEQRNAVGVVNAVNREQIQRSPDSDAGQAVQRVSGVTVQDGKYVFVRGLGERARQ